MDDEDELLMIADEMGQENPDPSGRNLDFLKPPVPRGEYVPGADPFEGLDMSQVGRPTYKQEEGDPLASNPAAGLNPRTLTPEQQVEFEEFIRRESRPRTKEELQPMWDMDEQEKMIRQANPNLTEDEVEGLVQRQVTQDLIQLKGPRDWMSSQDYLDMIARRQRSENEYRTEKERRFRRPLYR